MRWRTRFFKQRTIVISSSFFASCLEKWQSELSTSYLFEASDTRWWPHIYFLSTSLLISLHGDSLSRALPLLLRKSAFSHGKMHVLKSGSIWWGQRDKSASRTWKIKQHTVSVWAAGHCSSTGQCKEAWKSILWHKSKDIIVIQGLCTVTSGAWRCPPPVPLLLVSVACGGGSSLHLFRDPKAGSVGDAPWMLSMLRIAALASVAHERVPWCTWEQRVYIQRAETSF